MSHTIWRISSLPVLAAVMSLAPLAPAYAAGLSTFTLHAPTGVVNPTSTVTLTATAPAGTLLQWWVDTQPGWVLIQPYQRQTDLTLPKLAAGSYPVTVYALSTTAYQAHQWNQAVSRTAIINVGTTANMTVSSTTVHAHEAVTVTATSQHLLDPVYQLWIEHTNGTWTGSTYTANPAWSYTPMHRGTVQFVVYSKDLLAPNTAQYSLFSETAVTVTPAAQPQASQPRPSGPR